MRHILQLIKTLSVSIPVKGFIKLLIIAAIIAGIWFLWTAFSEKPTQISYDSTPLIRKNMDITIDATGVTEPYELVDVGAQVSGQITRFGTDVNGRTVDYSSQVKAGQLLAEIDKLPVELDIQRAEAAKAQAEAAIARAKATIQQNKAKHHQAQLNRQRAEKLGPGDALSKSSYDQYIADEEAARANVQASEASLLEAEASLKQAEATLKRELRNLDYTTIKSPVDGVIVKRLVNLGQTVVSSMSASSLFYIATDLSQLKIWAAVNEADIASIERGQKVQFTVDAHPGKHFTGTVDRIRLDATMTSNVVTYIVEINVPNPEKLLIPYLTANVQFIVKNVENSFIVNNSILRFSPNPSFLSPEILTRREELEKKVNNKTDGLRKGIVWEQTAENTLVPHLVVRKDTDGMNTHIEGDTLKENMKLISKMTILSDDLQPEADVADTGGSNPFAPKMPKRRQPSTGNAPAKSPTSGGDTPPPPHP